MLRKLVDLVGIYLSHRVLEHNGRDHARLVLAAFFLIRNRVIEEIIESLSADRVSKGGGQACVNVGQHRLEHSRDGQQFLPDGGDAYRKLDLAGPPHPANPQPAQLMDLRGVLIGLAMVVLVFAVALGFHYAR